MTGGRRAAERTGPLAGPVDLPGLEVAPPGVLPVPGNRWDLALAAAPGDARALDRDPGRDPASDRDPAHDPAGTYDSAPARSGTHSGTHADARTDAPARGGPPSVTVVVTHFEQPRELARTLHALTRQTGAGTTWRDVEVVVADDGSREPPAVPDGVRLVRQADRGFRAGAARNLGAAAGRGEVLVFLDADTTPEPGFLSAMVRLPACCPEALVVGRRRHADLAATDPAAPVEQVGPQRELPAPAWLDDAYAASRDLLDADERSYRFVIAAVLACSRWLFEGLGGFDETFRAYGGEDWELAARVWRHGGLLAHAPDAVAWHDGPDWAGRDEVERRARKLDETLAVARRLDRPGATTTGLRLGPPDPVVVVAEGLDPTGVAVCVDSLLVALPRARVHLSRADHARLGGADDRLRLGRPDLRTASRLLEVRRPVRGPAAAWRAVLDAVAGVDAPGVVRVGGEVGSGDGPGDGAAEWLRLTDLRTVRRRRRWARAGAEGVDALFGETTLTGLDLRPVAPDASFESYLGGWG